MYGDVIKAALTAMHAIWLIGYPIIKS